MSQYLCVLGRQPKISIAELEAVFGNATPIGTQLALINSPQTPDISRLGGTLKIAKVLDEKPTKYLSSLPAGKITLGISDFRKKATARSAQGEALFIKKLLKNRNGSLRIIPNNDGAILSTATTLHNSIGGKNPHKVELIITDSITALVQQVQSIIAYTKRDQTRPARDARVGMLPPKLAQILVNLSTGPANQGRLLDPFCGTGVILQEASLIDLKVYGTDLEPRMIDYSEKNLKWIGAENVTLETGDATKHQWSGLINFVSSEIYLGQPFSTPPTDIKLKEVQHVTGSILRSFLRNLHKQIPANTPVTLAIPAWKRLDGTFSHLKVLDELDQLGYNLHRFKNLDQGDLLYYRPDQVVAREILVLRSK